MSLTGNGTIKPPGVTSGKSVKFYDFFTSSAETITAYAWDFGDYKIWTPTAPPSTHINLANADTHFTVDEQVCFLTGDIPLGLNYFPTVYYVKTVTTTYIEVSTTIGGAAVGYTDSGTGTFYISHASTQQNPTFIYHPTITTTATYAPRLCAYGSTSGWTPYSVTPYVSVLGSSAETNKPSTDVYQRVSVFLYNGDNATLINRNRTTDNNLLFTELTCTGSINRAGTAAITILDEGDSTATEQSLISNGYTTETNVAIIVGYDVVWSGRILRATQSKMSQYDEPTTIKQWKLECESDISKMSKQNVTATGTLTNSVGWIVTSVCNNAVSGDIQWVNNSIISNEGADISYLCTSKDMYSQFISLANLCKFDWRTRIKVRRYNVVYDGTDTFTATTYGVATNALVGHWLIIINESGLFPISYGRVTGNVVLPAGTITCTTLTNEPDIPVSTSIPAIVIGDPYLDFVSNISETSPIVTYTMNQSESTTLYNGYEFDDKTDKKSLATKVVVTGKSAIVPSVDLWAIGMSNNAVYTISLPAKDAWNTEEDFFQNSTYITQKTWGWLYSYTGSATTLKIVGHGYAIKNGDEIGCYVKRLSTELTTATSFTVNAAPTEQTESDGTPTTTLSMASAVDTSSWAKYGIIYVLKLYVKNSLYTTGTVTLNVGNEYIQFDGDGNDAVYGPYMTIYSLGAYRPHSVGGLVSTQTYGESTLVFPYAAPQTGSPIEKYGVIQKTFAVDTICDVTDFEIYATQLLVANSYYFKRGTFWCHPYDFSPQDIPAGSTNGGNTLEYNVNNRFLKEGSRISVTTKSGDTPEEFQIVDWSYDANKMKVEITLGDFDRNIFTLIGEKTAALTSSIT